jgi:hypothetical protein
MYYIAYLDRSSGMEVKIIGVETKDELLEKTLYMSNYLAVEKKDNGKFILQRKGLYKSFLIVEFILVSLFVGLVYFLIKKYS